MRTRGTQADAELIKLAVKYSKEEKNRLRKIRKNDYVVFKIFSRGELYTFQKFRVHRTKSPKLIRFIRN